jgi:hypothetical protein
MNYQEPNQKIDRFLISWCSDGLEAIINVSEKEREAIINVLKDEPVEWKNPIMYLILRARFNSQRHYEIYSFESELDQEQIIELFDNEPQTIVDAIRRVGTCLYDDRAQTTVKII